MEEAPSTSMERVLLRTDSASLTQPRETRCRKKEKFLLNGILTGHLCQLLHIGGVPKSYQLELPSRKPCREFSKFNSFIQSNISSLRIPPPRRSHVTCHQGPYRLAATGLLIENEKISFSRRYNLQLKVDGVEVSNNKAIEYRDHETPYLNAIVNK